jgi:hypothetical protein
VVVNFSEKKKGLANEYCMYVPNQTLLPVLIIYFLFLFQLWDSFSRASETKK